MTDKPVKKAAKVTPDRRRGDQEVARAIKSLDKSNVGVEEALKYVGDGLKAIQASRRRDVRRTFAVAFVVLAILIGLAINAYEGRQARHKLVDQSDTQTQTLQIVKRATSPKRQAQGQKQLAEALRNINCDNQRNIQRAMLALGTPYELTEECK